MIRLWEQDYYYTENQRIMIPTVDKTLIRKFVHDIDKKNKQDKNELREIFFNYPKQFPEVYRWW